MELKGKLDFVDNIQEGQGARGPWKKQLFVIETMEQYPKKIAFVAWNERCDDLANLYVGDEITVSFDVESREFNGKWYTDLKAWRIMAAQHAAQGAPTQIQNPPQQPLPPMPGTEQQINFSEGSDDLPF